MLSLEAVDGVEPMTLKRLLHAVRHVGGRGRVRSPCRLERSNSELDPRGRDGSVPFARRGNAAGALPRVNFWAEMLGRVRAATPVACG